MVDTIMTVNNVNRNSGNEPIILRIWLDCTPASRTLPLFRFEEVGHNALDYIGTCTPRHNSNTINTYSKFIVL